MARVLFTGVRRKRDASCRSRIHGGSQGQADNPRTACGPFDVEGEHQRYLVHGAKGALRSADSAIDENKFTGVYRTCRQYRRVRHS